MSTAPSARRWWAVDAAGDLRSCGGLALGSRAAGVRAGLEAGGIGRFAMMCLELACMKDGFPRDRGRTARLSTAAGKTPFHWEKPETASAGDPFGGRSWGEMGRPTARRDRSSANQRNLQRLRGFEATSPPPCAIC